MSRQSAEKMRTKAQDRTGAGAKAQTRAAQPQPQRRDAKNGRADAKHADKTSGKRAAAVA
jgi:hypothetical protein